MTALLIRYCRAIYRNKPVEPPAISDSVTAAASASTLNVAEASHDETHNNVQTLSKTLSLGRSKRKQATARQKQLDEVNNSNFNDCLCGSVVIPASEGALMCKQVGCETQWVSILT